MVHLTSHLTDFLGSAPVHIIQLNPNCKLLVPKQYHDLL